MTDYEEAFLNKTVWMMGVVALVVSAIAACGDSDPVDQGPDKDPPITLTLSPDSVLLMPGDTSAVVANWVRPTGVTADVLITIYDVVGGVIATVEESGVSSTDIKLVTVFSATDAHRQLKVVASGAGMAPALDSIQIRVIGPTP